MIGSASDTGRPEWLVMAGGATFAVGCCAERLDRDCREDAVVVSASGVGKVVLH